MPLEVAMLKYVLAGTTALAIAGASFAYAQQPGHRAHARGPQLKAEDIAALGDARIAALKAGLKLTPEQEKNWPAVETAMRDLAKQRSERFAARASAEKPKDPIERLSQRAEVMQERGAALKKLADAAGPLYKSLDDGQKRRFVMLAKLGMQGHRGHEGWRHHHQRGGNGERGPTSPDSAPRAH
jgi:hypothetical protein